jgi:carbonic anhydrase/acetyltransferase-like protein (isoleucine patch superfamily)
MDKVTILPYDRIYQNFIDPKYLHDGHDEYYYRDQQVKKPEGGWRHLRSDEIERLVLNNNSASNWDDIWVTDQFDTAMIRNNHFFGMVRIGRVTRHVLQYHDLRVPVGITDSSIISCDIGDDVAVHDVHYMANCIIGDRCILFNIQEISTTDHSKFGNGTIKEGEPEDVRVWLEVMNETGSRKIMPFDGMTTADAYLWAKYVDDTKLQERLKEITQASVDIHRGYYGTIGEGCVIKNCWILKDAKVGPHCYIKGASKLKNVTINSSEEEPSQIGEGVILVNGVTGYGCRIFYSVVATRFVLGDNCNLKYGARLIHSVLGDNSTISCCEVLNNIIFPSHEQHHNNSFLISACVMGQSNMAAGATIGSNHNSRATDGEIVASRGFWPGLCSSVKHSSRFASFTLLSKADYPNELDIRLPFCLVSNNAAKDELHLMPAYWWMYNMYALARNTSKYQSRDKRKRKIQNIEFETLAPDTVEEIIEGRKLLEVWVAKAYLRSQGEDPDRYEYYNLRECGKNLLDNEPYTVEKLEVLGEKVEKGRRKVVIDKALKAYHAYGDMIVYYAVKTCLNYLESHPGVTMKAIVEHMRGKRLRKWINLGGQTMPEEYADQLRADIRDGVLNTWDDIHHRYDELWKDYQREKLRHAYFSLMFLYKDDTDVMTKEMWQENLDQAARIQQYICDQVYESRKKDYDNEIRSATFRNEAEKLAVVGRIDDVSFVKQIRQRTKEFLTLVQKYKE